MDKQSQQTQVAVCNASTAAAFAAALVAAALECFRHAGSYLFANQLRGSIPARLAALRKLSVLCVTAQPSFRPQCSPCSERFDSSQQLFVVRALQPPPHKSSQRNVAIDPRRVARSGGLVRYAPLVYRSRRRWLTRRCGSVAYQNMLEGTIPDAMRTLSQLTRLYCPSFLLEAFPPSPLLLTVPSVHHRRTAPTEGHAFHVASRQTRLRFSDGRQAELVCSLR
jgi:hypothetical protein